MVEEFCFHRLLYTGFNRGKMGRLQYFWARHTYLDKDLHRYVLRGEGNWSSRSS